MTITQRVTPNYAKGRSGWTPDMIVCHTTEGAYEGAVSWLTNPDSGVSSHYVVAKDGRITQLVSLNDTAWGNGTNNTATDNRNNAYSLLQSVRDRKVNANYYTVSIEHEGKVAETKGSLAPAQLEATIWLISHIRAEIRRLFDLDIPICRQHIVAHSDIVPKWKPYCPGPDFPFDEIIRRLSAGQEAPQAVSAQEPSAWALAAWNWARGQGITDGTNPQNPATREQVITMLHNYSRLK